MQPLEYRSLEQFLNPGNSAYSTYSTYKQVALGKKMAQFQGDNGLVDTKVYEKNLPFNSPKYLTTSDNVLY